MSLYISFGCIAFLFVLCNFDIIYSDRVFASLPYIIVIVGVWFGIVNTIMAYIFFKTANIFKNLLLEGNQREKRKANVVISLIIFLMLAETVYWSTKTYIWFKIFSVEDPKYTINDVEHFLDAGNILY